MAEAAFVITVDGPSGAGKGTLCYQLAQATGYELLDSGALYRLTALAAVRQKVAFDDIAALAKLAEALDITFKTSDAGVAVFLEGDVVTRDIRQESVGMGASQVAAIPEVRAALLQRQRDFVFGREGLIADGRDMGTVVFPQAQAKLFLTASAKVRATRRVKQLELAGETPDYTQILADIEARDARDSNRSTAPLKPADDALQLDSTHMSIDDVAQAALLHIRQIQN